MIRGFGGRRLLQRAMSELLVTGQLLPPAVELLLRVGLQLRAMEFQPPVVLSGRFLRIPRLVRENLNRVSVGFDRRSRELFFRWFQIHQYRIHQYRNHLVPAHSWAGAYVKRAIAPVAGRCGSGPGHGRV